VLASTTDYYLSATSHQHLPSVVAASMTITCMPLASHMMPSLPCGSHYPTIAALAIIITLTTANTSATIVVITITMGLQQFIATFNVHLNWEISRSWDFHSFIYNL
jgi:hypothetical protein